jgi:hypothetical protein
MLAGLCGKLLQPIKTAIGGLGAGFAVGLGKIVDDLPAMFAPVRNKLLSSIDDMVPGATGRFRMFFERIGIAIGEGFTKMFGWFGIQFGNMKIWLGLYVDEFFTIGKNLISGMMRGIGSMGSALMEAVKRLAREALAALKGALGIKSPSKEFALVGMDMMRGMALGIGKGSGIVIEALEGIGNQTIGANLGVPEIASGAGRSQAPISITVNGALDAEGTARTILRVLQDAERRTGVRL